MTKGLFKISHNSEDIKESPILSKEALEAMKNLEPDKNGIKMIIKELKEYQEYINND